jgi:hypothetical protein
MVKIVHIFVEGDADMKFVSDYIAHIKPDAKIEIDRKQRPSMAKVYQNESLMAVVHGLNGWADIENMKTAIAQYKDEGNDVLVIFDADTSKNNGGFAVRKQQISSYGLSLDGIFLFPNNKDDAELETLLENIINEKNKSIFDCWDKYELCLQEYASKKTGKTLTTPAKKSKIYAYLSALLDGSKKQQSLAKDPNRNYSEAEHWNLDAEYLWPLKEFLLKYLTAH